MKFYTMHFSHSFEQTYDCNEYHQWCKNLFCYKHELNLIGIIIIIIFIFFKAWHNSHHGYSSLLRWDTDGLILVSESIYHIIFFDNEIPSEVLHTNISTRKKSWKRNKNIFPVCLILIVQTGGKNYCFLFFSSGYCAKRTCSLFVSMSVWMYFKTQS